MIDANMMMVNPNEVVIDMPVDEKNVQEKMVSIQEIGIVQPITLWLHGLRVIDGFHRLVAAQRLGSAEVPCYVVNCDESAFWDARIQSARQHHTIETARLSAWIFESWKTTEWYKPSAVSADLLEMYHCSPEYISIIDALWTHYRKERVLNASMNFVGNLDLDNWLSEKARRWGVRKEEIVDRILSSSPLQIFNRHTDHVADLESAKHDLTLVQRQVLANNLVGLEVPPFRGSGVEHEELSEWVKNEVTTRSDIKEIPSLREYADRARQRERETRIEQVRLGAERQYQFEQTPQGQAQIHKRRVEAVRDASNYIVRHMLNIEHLLDDSRDFADPISGAIVELIELHNEHFKSKGTRLKDLLSQNNARLRRQVNDLQKEIDSLRSALALKSNLPHDKLKEVVVQYGE